MDLVCMPGPLTGNCLFMTKRNWNIHRKSERSPYGSPVRDPHLMCLSHISLCLILALSLSRARSLSPSLSCSPSFSVSLSPSSSPSLFSPPSPSQPPLLSSQYELEDQIKAVELTLEEGEEIEGAC